MNVRLTRRFIVGDIKNLNISSPIRYERYYINNNLRIQKRQNNYFKEILNDNNVVIDKIEINDKEFEKLKFKSYKKIIRDSYLYLDDSRVSIKKYYYEYEGLIRAEVKFSTYEEMISYIKEPWMGTDITNSSLAFDKFLSKLNNEEFKCELKKQQTK